MPQGAFSKLLGTLTSFFQIGGSAGPGINSNGAALETKNAANSGFAVHRGATPVGDNDFTTKAYVDKTSKPIAVAQQISGAAALPSNSSTEQYYVVTTTGPNGTIGQLYWDDGLNTGTVQVIPIGVGNTIVTEAAFTGGTISLAANQMYVWSSGSAWTNISPNVSGATYMIRLPLALVTATSATSIPANAIIYDAKLDVTTAYTAGATISLGITGSTSLFMGTGDNTPQTTGVYQDMQDTSVGASPLPLVATIAGTTATVGAGFAIILYGVPNA